MKTLLSLLFILLLTPLVNAESASETPKGEMISNSEEEGQASLTAAEQAAYKKEEDDKKNDYILISKFIETEFIAKAEKKMAKLQKQINSLKKKMGKEGISKKAADKYKKEIDHLSGLLEAEKLWATYKNAYILYKEAYNKNDFKRADKAADLIKKIYVKYKKLTDSNFPKITSIFYSKYKEQLVGLRNKHIN